MSIKFRMIMLFTVIIIGIISLSLAYETIERTIYTKVTTPQLSKVLYEKYAFGIKSAVEVEAQDLAARVKGITNKQEIYSIIEKETEFQRFFPDNEGYFFTYTTNGVRINVPINKSLNGKDLTNLKDAKGYLFVQEFVRQARNGGGFVEYWFEKPGQGNQPKLSYVCLIPGTDVLIGTGVYIDGVVATEQKIQSIIEKETQTYHLYVRIAAAGILLFVLGFAVYIVHSVNAPLTSVSKYAGSVAEGNLDTHADFERGMPKEIKDLSLSIEVMVSTLKEKILEADRKGNQAAEGMHQAQEALKLTEEAKAKADAAKAEGMLFAAQRLEGIAKIVSSASAQLSQQIRDSEQGAAEQAHRLSETATAMVEMNSTVMEVAKNAGDASRVATGTRSKAEIGGKIVQQAVEGIRKVQEQSEHLKGDMATLGESAKAIGQIMGVISDIADQTNLLALNAAIEAARAGDAGRGFAVVADEVRKLAEKTMSSTTDVGNAIQSIQDSASKSMNQLDQAIQAIENATSFVNRSGEALLEIEKLVESSADQVQAIATASEEQSAASEEINRSIMVVNSIASQTAQTMTEAEEAVTKLVSQTTELNNLIREMKKM